MYKPCVLFTMCNDDAAAAAAATDSDDDKNEFEGQKNPERIT